MPTKPVLSSLLDEAALARLKAIWPEQCVQTHGPRERLPALFNDPWLATIESLTQAYSGDLMETDVSVGTRMKPVCGESAAAVYARGVTAYLSDVASLFDGTDALLAGLEEELGIAAGSARIGAFVSPAGNGASCHYDVLDVISIQLIGAKRFYVAPVSEIRFPCGYQYNPDMPLFDDLYPQISDGFPDPEKPVFEQVDMQPGSVLCVPRGTWHYTRADSDSLALSIVLSPPTELDRLTAQLSATLLQSGAWRRPCYGIGRQSAADYTALQAVVSRLAARENDPASPSRCFGEDSRYLRDPTVSVEIQAGGDHYDIAIHGRSADGKPLAARMSVPAQTADVFEWLLAQNGPFSVRQAMAAFPSLPLDYFRQIFQVASETALARYLWFDPLED